MTKKYGRVCISFEFFSASVAFLDPNTVGSYYSGMQNKATSNKEGMHWSWRLKALMAVLILIVVCGLLELAAHMVVPGADSETKTPPNVGWQAEFFSQSFGWHEPDPELLWRMRPKLENSYLRTNSEGLIGEEVSRPKPDGTYRILLLGDSSPVGLGLPSYRYAFGPQVEALVEGELGFERPVELVNASVSGYTSEQIRLWLERHGWSYEPDLVLLYCGNNDASISGMVSDRDLLADQRMTGLRRLLEKSALYRLMKAMLKPAESIADESKLVVRVEPERFSENLENIAAQCRDHDCPLMVIKPPVPLLWPAGLQFKLFAFQESGEATVHMPEEMTRILGRDLRYCFDSAEITERYGKADWFTKTVYASAYKDSLTPAQAVELYEAELEGEGGNATVYNNLGVSLSSDKKYDQAEVDFHEARTRFASERLSNPSIAELTAGSVFLYNLGYNRYIGERFGDSSFGDPWIYLDSALQADFFSLRIKRDYWNRIDSLGQEPGVYVVDAPRMFDRNDRERLFIDHCHPTVRGHSLIALQILDVMRLNRLLPR